MKHAGVVTCHTGMRHASRRVWDCEWGDLLWLLRGHVGAVKMLVLRDDMTMLSARCMQLQTFNAAFVQQ